MPGPAPKRGRRLGAALGVAAFLVSAPAALAAEGEAGIFTWRPSLRVTTVATDNAFYDESGKEGSIGGWIAPRLELSYRRPSLEVGADLGVDFRRYADHDSLGDELYRGVAWLEAPLGHGLNLRVSNAYVPQPVRVGLPEDEGPNLVQTNRSELALSWWRGLPGGRELELGVQGSYFLSDDYAEVVPVAGGGVGLDRSFRSSYGEGLAFAEVQTPLGEGTAAYLRTQGSYRSFQDVSRASHGNLSVLLGVRSGRWRNLDLELAGGVGALGFDRFGDELRALGRGSVRYRFGEGWAARFEARHLNTPNLAGEEAMESTGELGLEKRFGAATLAGLRFFVTRFDGDLRDSGVNLFGGGELELRRQISRHLQLLATYRHWRNAGAFSLDDFAQNRILLQVSIRR